MNKIRLSFTIGPVQSFVGQARRTRDLWSGSWLLSFLAETAFVEAGKSATQAIIPHRENIQGAEITAFKSAIGGMPNRFELEYDSEEDAQNAALSARDAFYESWNKIAAGVFEEYVEHASGLGKHTEDIWKRQIGHFWEISWVIAPLGENEKTLGLLTAARKNIRNTKSQPEGGVKCSLMGNLQELSGYSNTSAQNKFWKKLVERTGTHDFRRRKKGVAKVVVIERLSAIALIKRLYPNILKSVYPQIMFEPTSPWPSTSFLAQVPSLRINASEKNLDELIEKEGHSDEDNRAREKEDAFYALLVMDGDSMGKLISSMDGDTSGISKSLNDFAEGVDTIVVKHFGKTVYAGGDDVVALLPTNTVLDASEELAALYSKCFDNPRATLSGAVVFAFHKHPLRQVVKMGHHLLDNIAKARTGRDAIAVGIIQGSGLQAVWSVPWRVYRGEEGNSKVSDITQMFGKGEGKFGASYLYMLRDRFNTLFETPLEEPGSFRKIDFEDGENLLFDLAHAEHRRRKKGGTKMETDETRKEVEPIFELTKRWTRSEKKDTKGKTKYEEIFDIKPDPSTFGFDGWRVARFLKSLEDNAKKQGENNAK